MDLVFQNLTSEKKYSSKFFEKILIAGIKELKLDNKSMGVSINLVGEGRIKKLNNKYRHKNKVTDVISFPMLEKGTRSLVIGHQPWVVTDIGDIFICLSFAKKQAKRENISIERKLAQLTVHGFLHLLGYDHEGLTTKAKQMFDLESGILNKLIF
ncbi:MAG: rRNA maturation RNase YbeY [Candidatus Yanofskybacteria bacterium RIFCSPHIGHO2_01_FULL_39_8b]|uniref:Endoribonuclease YbeY n=1 Tax=Candidatus Yanofskybacteria bacterium RIFCSPHIGHO2_01_FULL_39_8b TaxID=1802659 RepID=A0A1F8E930_9BACT|nr:MAG: rRNA maturation RNase YbeY [Candidatus Yanofskybacteria bacterium RIFCSPHIGHO2_01_FULL_39_8b]